ncbi:MAG: hypothetical protein Q4F41_18240 [Eubacteriales bacterium]|nr:hypothetical protein [Eubacteriales bacterium]
MKKGVQEQILRGSFGGVARRKRICREKFTDESRDAVRKNAAFGSWYRQAEKERKGRRCALYFAASPGEKEFAG